MLHLALEAEKPTALPADCTFVTQGIAKKGDPVPGDLWWHEALIRPCGQYAGITPQDFVQELYMVRTIPWVDGVVLSRCGNWLQGQPRGFRLSVNIHPSSLEDFTFLSQVLKLAEQCQRLGHSLCLELLEYGTYSNRKTLLSHVARVKDEGVLIALDDFNIHGDCYLLYRAGLVDILKIDKLQVAPLERVPAAIGEVRKIQELAQNIGASVVAEGVETQLQRDMIEAQGVQFCQGYLIHRPQIIEA